MSQEDFFRARLEHMIDLKHPLAVLTQRLQKWPRKSEQRYKWKLWVYCRTEGGLETRSF